jgi:WD40 repeat protein
MWHANRVWYARFSPDGRWVATASEDNTARIWNAKTGFPITEPLTHRAMVTSLAWLPDSRRLLTGSQDGTVRLWKRTDLDTVPPWLADLAEALAGKQYNGEGESPVGQPDRLAALRRLAESKLDDTPQNRWLRWFLIERVTGAVR